MKEHHLWPPVPESYMHAFREKMESLKDQLEKEKSAFRMHWNEEKKAYVLGAMKGVNVFPIEMDISPTVAEFNPSLQMVKFSSVLMPKSMKLDGSPATAEMFRYELQVNYAINGVALGAKEGSDDLLLMSTGYFDGLNLSLILEEANRHGFVKSQLEPHFIAARKLFEHGVSAQDLLQEVLMEKE